MRNRDESVKSILLAFSLAAIEGGKYVIQNDGTNTEMVKGFMRTFKADSPFAITCEVCSDKFKRLMNSQDPGQPSLSQVQSLNILKNREQMESADQILPVPETHTTTHDIFVSSFPVKTQCDAIVARIMEKSDLKPECFEVLQMINPKIKLKYRKFASFKIKAQDKATYNAIIDDKIWAPFAEAVPFDTEANAKAKSRQRKQPEPKPKQQKQIQLPQQEQPSTKKQNKASKNQSAPQPAEKSSDTHSKQPVVHQSRDRPLKNLQSSHKASRPRDNKGHRPLRRANDRGGYNSYRDDRGSNFHGNRWNNHRPIKSELKSLLSLLTRVLSEY